ncbi:MAG: PqqD family protein [Mesorhizobium sp.]|nr:PqqD family protein [Mesorhizobium sp.]
MRLLAGVLLLASSMAAHAAESAYTKVDFEKDCREVESDELGGSWTCKGYGEYGIRFAEGDLRQTAFYGHVGSWFEKGAFETFTGFNHAGDTIEWRLESGVPVATIRRWFVSPGTDDKGDPLPEVQVLVISKVGQKGAGDACVVGYVEATANKDANVLSRKVADEVVLLNVKTSDYYSMNPTGVMVWELVCKNKKLDEIVAAVAAQFDADEGRVKKDVLELLKKLESEKIVARA